MKYPMMVLAAAALAASASATPIVPGTPITTPPAGINALGGHVIAVYMFADASHTDILGLTTPPPLSPIFCNHALSGTCTANSPGDTMDLGARSGALEFTLQDNNTSNMFVSDMPDADGNYHAVITANYADFGVGAMDPNAAAAISGFSNVTFIGWEDKTIHDPNADWDYNDLIFAFSATRPTHQNSPEPLTLALVGAGLMGAFGLRRVKKS